jgi:hypothetical protein
MGRVRSFGGAERECVRERERERGREERKRKRERERETERQRETEARMRENVKERKKTHCSVVLLICRSPSSF